MASVFDDLMQAADDQLFAVFGVSARYQTSKDSQATQPVTVTIDKDVELAGPDGMIRTVQCAAQIRLQEVAQPKAGALLMTDCDRWRLDERLASDGLVEVWSLLPVR